MNPHSTLVGVVMVNSCKERIKNGKENWLDSAYSGLDLTRISSISSELAKSGVESLSPLTFHFFERKRAVLVEYEVYAVTVVLTQHPEL